jgi:hypothetical protein
MGGADEQVQAERERQLVEAVHYDDATHCSSRGGRTSLPEMARIVTCH